jgi:ABC-type glycerol-3-phosphate transport system substrate-binding protein
MTGGPWNTAAGVTYGNYIFTGPDGTNLWSLTVQYFGGYQGLLGAQDGVGGINVTLPGSGKSAVFVWAVAIHNNAVALSDQLNFSYDSTQYGFSGGGFGLTSSRSLTSFVITPNVAGDGVLLEEVDVANSILPQDGGGGDPGPTAAPEGVTIALVGGGLLVLFGSKRKFIRQLAI